MRGCVLSVTGRRSVYYGQKAVVALVIALALLISGYGSGGDAVSTKSNSDSGIESAIDRFQDAESYGQRRDILATLTADSPQRDFLSGSDENYRFTRERLDTAQYRIEYIKRRDIKIDGDNATLFADAAETRSDASADGSLETSVAPGILFELRKVDGTWLVHDVLSWQRQQRRIIGGR
ncbi:hypothetical protein GCM10009624_11910 [Gordonia sinesedis]